MTEILIRIQNPHRQSESFAWDGINSFEVSINGVIQSQVKRFAIDIDEGNKENGRLCPDVTYTLEKYMDINQMFYDNTDVPKEYDDWCAVKNG